ncbi:hypothetical protein [Aquibacillus kalidii]|uniref:hypothetical protein n=1 Tax=Aquibacillus kalidii TaxID=2762597 RepID=UPI0016471704|nr:hypothetical protein [Aquibacillus kalidii]
MGSKFRSFVTEKLYTKNYGGRYLYSIDGLSQTEGCKISGWQYGRNAYNAKLIPIL